MQKVSYKSLQGHYKQLLADVRKKDAAIISVLLPFANSR